MYDSEADANRRIRRFVGWVVGGTFLACALLFVLFVVLLTSFDFDLDLEGIELSFIHPHFSPPDPEGRDLWVEVIASLMLRAPERIFSIRSGETQDQAVGRFMGWLYEGGCEELDEESRSFRRCTLLRWLLGAAEAHVAYDERRGDAEAALSARPGGNPSGWTDETPGARYRYELARVQAGVFLDALEMALGGSDVPDGLSVLYLSGIWRRSPGGVAEDGQATRILFRWE